MPVGRQEGVGDFVYQEKGPWRLRNKAWDRAGPACGWSGQAGQAGLGLQWGQWPVASDQPLFSLNTPWYFWPLSMVGSGSLTYIATAVGSPGCPRRTLAPKIPVGE